MTSTLINDAAAVRDRLPIRVAVCCLAIILALVMGVGLSSGLVLRHIVQTLPLWMGVVLGTQRSRVAGWVVLPLFLFWLVLMVIIWLYLLGVASLVSGDFTPLEIAMTLVVGAASMVGLAGAARLLRSLPVSIAVGLFVLSAAVQWECFRLSFLPGIAHR